MSELLLRGWNVAVPVVDLGDDAFVIDDRDKATRRVQVKTSATEARATPRFRATFKLSREQLRTVQPIELYYILMMRTGARWRFLVIPRAELLEIRSAYVENGRARGGPGKRPRGDGGVKTDSLRLDVQLDGDSAIGWDASLSRYLDCWPADLREVEGGPGSVVGSGAPGVTAASSGDLAPSRDLER